jgi:hypothetical protein
LSPLTEHHCDAQKRADLFSKSEIAESYSSPNRAESLMQDKRHLPRTRIRRNARIVMADRSSMVNCTVLDVTNKGARLGVATSDGIPLEFNLTFDSCRSVRPCYMVWRAGTQIGVAFVP